MLLTFIIVIFQSVNKNIFMPNVHKYFSSHPQSYQDPLIITGDIISR